MIDSDWCTLEVALGEISEKLGCVPENANVDEDRICEASLKVPKEDPTRLVALARLVSDGAKDDVKPLPEVTLGRFEGSNESIGSPVGLLEPVMMVSDDGSIKVVLSIGITAVIDGLSNWDDMVETMMDSSVEKITGAGEVGVPASMDSG